MGLHGQQNMEKHHEQEQERSLLIYDFKKLIYLGASKKDFYFGALAGYVGLALLISLLNTGIHLLIDPLNHTQTVINLMDVCGWTENNIFFAFIQQTAFLLLFMVFLHVLLSMQPHWYGRAGREGRGQQ